MNTAKIPVIFTIIYRGSYDLEEHLKAGEDPNIVFEGSFTPLLYAIEKNCYRGVTTLIKYGADVNLRPPVTGQVPLIEAIREGSNTLFDHLLKANADVHAKDNSGNTPLRVALSRGQRHMVNELIKKGALAEFQKPQRPYLRFAPLHLAISCRRADILDILRSHIQPPTPEEAHNQKHLESIFDEKILIDDLFEIIKESGVFSELAPLPTEKPDASLETYEIHDLAAKYLSGKRCRVDYERYLHYMRLGAARGDPSALGIIGLHHMYGRHGLTKDNALAFNYFKLNAIKILELADMVDERQAQMEAEEAAVKENPELVVTEYTKQESHDAAYVKVERDYGHLYLYYPICLLFGIGCDKDRIQAYAYLHRAAQRGFKYADEMLNTGKIADMLLVSNDFPGLEELSTADVLSLIQGKNMH